MAPSRPFVDWEAYGICKYWMQDGAERCYSRVGCDSRHPPKDMIPKLYSNPESRLEFATRVPAEHEASAAASHHAPAVPPPPPPPSPPPPPPPAAKQVPEGSAEPKPSASRPQPDQDESTACGRKSFSNFEPLGKPSKVLHASTVDQDMPTAAARTVWKRAEYEDEDTMPYEGDYKIRFRLPTSQKGGYWGARNAKQEVPERNDADGHEKGRGDVENVAPRGLGQQQARTLATPRPATDMPPPRAPPKRKAAPTTVPPYTSLTPPFAPRSTMGATKRLSNGDPKPPVGPHPSTIRVAAPYSTQASIEKRLFPTELDHQERSLAEAREDNNRLQGVAWLDNVRRALQLPVRTYTTACELYHKFRLTHPLADYAWADAAAASLLVACKTEDTLKKSKDILAAAYNLRAGLHDVVGADDVVFEAPSKVVIGIERLVLEASGFDFRTKEVHKRLLKIQKSLPESSAKKPVGALAWTVLIDLHRTFAPIKHTTATQAFACLEMAAHLHVATGGDAAVIDHVKAIDIKKWSVTRAHVMETLLDALDLYTQHTTASIVGTHYSLDEFLRVRLALNKECSADNIPRYQTRPDRPAATAGTLQVANGHPTPVSPPEAGAQSLPQPTTTGLPALPEGGGTLRFILNPQLAADEKAEVQKFFTEEWEEYEEEIEVPVPRAKSRERDNDRERDKDRPERIRDSRPAAAPQSRVRESDRRSDTDDRRSIDRRSIDRSRDDVRDRDRERDRERDRDRVRDRDRELERDRVRVRDRDRDRRYDDRRYDDRDRYDRRDRRYDDDRRRDRR
ncbi:hypothetical protein LTR08_000048 [Meristemomyces frigidus]|nr:hypothetical protein LTR08_000048 [Meristemomyces frigidus]